MDLRFKIIADYVAAGWDKSKAAVASLKGSMSDFFRSSVGGWGKFAAGAAAAFSAVLAGAKSLRDGVLRELERMEVQDVADMDWNQRFTRKAGKVSSQEEKDKLQEDVDREARDVRMKFDQLSRKEATQFPWEKLKDAAERKINEAMGLGNKTDDERMLDQLGDRLKQLQNKAEFVRNLKVESRFEAFQAEEGAFTQEQMRVQDLENTTDALVKEKKAADALEVAMKDLDAAKDEFAKKPNDEGAETAVKRQFELVKKLTAEWQNAAKEAENYDPPATAALKERVNPWGPEMFGGTGFEPEARTTAAPGYGPSMGESLTRSNAGRLAKRMRSSIGGNITSFNTPAYLARAMAAREGATGRDSEQQDPRMIEMKKQTELLDKIEKKTGASA